MIEIKDSQTLKQTLEAGKQGVVRSGQYTLSKAQAKSGAVLHCEPGAVIDGNGADMILFSGGGKLHITGGRWQNSKRVVLQKGGSFIYCRFRDMVIRNCTQAFRIGISIGCSWVDIDVANGESAIVFSGEHQSNANMIVRLVASGLSKAAIQMNGRGNHAQVNNKVHGCTIHHGGGLLSATLARNLLVEGCYTEAMTATDIRLSNCQNSSIRENWFAPTPASVKERVKVTGNGSADVVRNSFVLAAVPTTTPTPDPQVGVRVNHAAVWQTVISRNYVNTAGLRLPYEERIAAGRSYIVEPYPGSGGVS